MVHKRLILPLALVLLSGLGFAWFVVVKAWLVFSLLSAVVWAFSARWLIRRVHEPERELQKILRNSKMEDYNFVWPYKDFATIGEVLSLWSQQIRHLKSAQQKDSLWQENVLDQLEGHILYLDKEQNLSALNHQEEGLPGMRHHLKAADWPEIFPFLKTFLESEERERVISLRHDGEKQKWRFQQKSLGMGKQLEKIIIVSNEQSLFERHEDQALEKILHVLTHEIMNSVSPISSLADTLGHHLQLESTSNGSYQLNEEQYQDLLSTAGIIQRRSAGLMSFVERYARFARLPRLQKTEIDWPSFLAEIQSLCEAELQKDGFTLSLVNLESQRPLYADRELMSQVLLNLIRNAQESMRNGPGQNLVLQVDQGDGYHYLKVIDEGRPIEESLIDQIFLPFFSTKKKGSGIGLSLSRKIVMAHGGRLYLQQKDGFKAFCIDLPF